MRIFAEQFFCSRDAFQIKKEPRNLAREVLSIRPYITELMEEAHEKGTPPMRPLFYESKEPIDTGRHYLVIDRFAFGRSADNACALDPFNEVPLHKEINDNKRQDSQQNACILHHAQIERI